MKDISELVEKRYIDFFTNPDSEYVEKSPENAGGWRYPEIMNDFRRCVVCMYPATKYNSEDNRPLWAKMRQKYYDDKPYVYPDEMITKLELFDNKELIAFIHYCVVYKERFCDGAYGDYAKDGFIGRALLRLRDLPLVISEND